jgi:hypothetical protein
MPGSDEQYDLVRVKDASSNSKADTFFVAPKHVGRDGAGTERIVLTETEEPPVPPEGDHYLFLDENAVLKEVNSDGTVDTVGGGGVTALADDPYVTYGAAPDLANEKIHADLTGTELHDPAAHSPSHESGGTDEIDVSGLSGDLADAQDPKTHAATHSDAGTDPIDVTNLVNADTKADLTTPGGVLVAGQVPDLAITNTDVVADQAARLNLDAEEGDVAIQTDIDETFILTTNDPTVNTNWQKIQLDVLGAIDGQQILPSQVGSATSPTVLDASTADFTGTVDHNGNNVTNVAQLDAVTLVVNGQTQTVTTDQDAVDAVNAETSLSVDITGNADEVDGFDVQKNGTDGAGIINFKT